MVAKVKAKNLLTGRVYEGSITTEHPTARGEPVLLIDGKIMNLAQYDVKVPNAPFNDSLSPPQTEGVKVYGGPRDRSL
jgi:hypothetical protein